jgi:hypothetical protein
MFEATKTFGRYEVKRLTRPLGPAAHCLLVIPTDQAIYDNDVVSLTRAKEICCEFGDLNLGDISPDLIMRAMARFHLNGLVRTHALESRRRSGFFASYSLTPTGVQLLDSDTKRKILLHPPERSWTNPLRTLSYYVDDLKSILV